MADHTEMAIQNAFLKLLNEKPLKQITVCDIVEECHVNRNTFYYHFQDIPSLMTHIFEEITDRFIAENTKLTTIEECLNAIVKVSLENQRAILHIYRSANRDIFEQYQWRVCDYAVTAFLEEPLKGRNISPEDRRILIGYVRCLAFGVMMDWLESGLTEDVHQFIHRICILKQGELDRMIQNCEEPQKI